MRLHGRLAKIEQHKAVKPQTNGRILWAHEFADNAAWEAAQAEHRRLWPDHQGIRFIDDISFRDIFPHWQ